MKNLYEKIKIEIEKLEVQRQVSGGKIKFFSLRTNFYKLLLGALKFFLIIFDNSGDSFSLIFQRQGKETTPHSYREFKIYQRRIRILLLVLLVLLAVEIAIFKK